MTPYARVLRVGVDESPAPPLCFGIPGTAEFRGFEVDLLTSIASRLGSSLQCESMGWETALERLFTDGLDMLCRGVTITPERSRLVSFSDPYLETGLVLALRRDSSIQGASDLIGLKVGLRRATVAEEFVRRGCPGATACTFDSHAESFLALSNGKVSAVVDHETIATHFVQSDNRLKVTAIEGTRLLYGMVFGPANDSMRRAVNNALAQLRSDGTWQNLSDRWLAKRAPPRN